MSHRDAAFLLADLNEEQFDDVKARLLPPGGVVTDAFRKSCGPEYYLGERHLVLAAQFYYAKTPTVSALGRAFLDLRPSHREA